MEVNDFVVCSCKREPLYKLIRQDCVLVCVLYHTTKCSAVLACGNLFVYLKKQVCCNTMAGRKVPHQHRFTEGVSFVFACIATGSAQEHLAHDLRALQHPAF